MRTRELFQNVAFYAGGAAGIWLGRSTFEWGWLACAALGLGAGLAGVVVVALVMDVVE